MNTARLVEGMERHQIPLYLLAIVAGGLFGWLIPAAAEPLEISINPVLGLLLFVTFLGIPFAKIGQALRDGRFMVTVIILNFLIVPVVVFGLSRFVADDQALLIGVMMVLLTPCIDYVIVFSGLAGGSSDRLLAVAPLLMLTLAVVIGSQIVGVGQELRSLLAVIPIYIVFLVIMVPVGVLAARIARLDAGSTTAVVFSGATRNSLVVLPLALALPEPLALVALVVVTQTLVELIGMVSYVKALPRLIPANIINHA